MIVFWVLTSSTYALDLNLQQYGNGYNYTPEYSTQKSNYTFYSVDRGKSVSSTSSKSENAGYYNTLWTKFYWYKDKGNGYSFVVNWFAYKIDWEWITLYQAKYRGNEQYYNTLSLPSRVGYLYTSSAGVKNLFTEIFVNDNQFILYAPETNYCVSFVGDVKLENMMIVSNPWKDEQNLWIIQCQKMKAYSLTVDKNQAREVWKGNWVNKNFLKNLNFEKSYTITTGGTYLFPEWMRQIDQRRWFVYTEDIELQSMDWWGGATNNPNQWGNSDGSYKERLAEYNQCASYWQNVKTYTLYDRECYRWLLDDPADNRDFDIRLAPWKAIVDWNWEGELDIKTKDPICLKFKSRKPVYMAKYKDKRDEFIKDSQEYWLNPSQTINVAEKCGTRPSLKIKEWTEEKWLLDKIQDGFYRFRDNFNELWGKPIVSSGGQNLYNYDYRKDIEQLKFLREYCQWWTIIDKYLQTEEQYEAMKKSYCERYDKLKKEIERKYANWTWFYNGKSLSWALRDIENWADRDYNVWIWKKFVSLITDSFYSGYNSVDFVVPVCWKDNKNSFFEIFFYLFFFLTVFYLFKIFK